MAHLIDQVMSAVYKNAANYEWRWYIKRYHRADYQQTGNGELGAQSFPTIRSKAQFRGTTACKHS